MTSHALPPPAWGTEGVELIVIGASAGGVEAIGQLLLALPAHCAAAIAVVLHMPPDRASLLPKIYAERCRLPIKEVEDKEPVQSGTVYFAAPDYHMQIEPERRFSLSLDAPVNFSRPAIDVAFDSAARAYGAALLAIVLTGASADGAAGLKSVRARGGLAWVQDPARSAASTMPQAALSAAGADRILSLDDIAAGLASLGPAAAPAPGS